MVRRALQSVLGIGLGGLGVGAGARSIMGLRNLIMGNRQLLDTSAPIPRALPVPIPRPQQEDEREEEPLRKTAAMIRKEAQRPGLNWWQIPAGVALGTGGLVGGWKLMDMILDSRRRAELEQELRNVQTEYEDALRAQYEAALTKQGELDEVFEKLAFGGLGDLLHGALGAYVTALGASGLAGGLGGYHWARSRGRKKRLEEALRRRRLAMAGQPEPLYAYPVTLPPSKKRKAQEEEDRELS